MIKRYQKPEVKYVSLVAKEVVAADITDPAVVNGDINEGGMGIASSWWD